MFQIGLTSITFRQLSCEEVIALAAKSGLDGIEWGTDVHVTDPAAALRVGRLTKAAGLSNLSVGSYYRVGKSSPDELDTVLDIARAMDTDTVRIWAGAAGSEDLPEETRAAWTAQLEADARKAAARGIRLCCEYHAKTLTDTQASAGRLLREAPALSTYWQPVVYLPQEENVRALQAVLSRTVNIHVFAWTLEKGEIVRRPLSEGEKAWRAYLDVLRAQGGERSLLLEFVRDDAPEQCVADARTLADWAR